VEKVSIGEFVRLHYCAPFPSENHRAPLYRKSLLRPCYSQLVTSELTIEDLRSGQIPLGPVPRNFLVTSLTSS